MRLTTRAGVVRKPTMERHVVSYEEEDTPNNEIIRSRVGWSDELYLPKRSREETTPCLQVYMMIWVGITLYAVWTFIPYP